MKASPDSFEQEPVQTIQQPRASDILSGKDKLCVSHAGSKRFRAVIETYRRGYSLAKTKYQKMMITKEIYERFVEDRCRFLKYNSENQLWVELSAMAARDKVGHALRFANRKKRRKTASTCSVSSVEESVTSSTEPLTAARTPSLDDTSPIPLRQNPEEQSHVPTYQSSFRRSLLSDPVRPEFEQPRGAHGGRKAPLDLLEPFPMIGSANPGASHIHQESIGGLDWSMLQESMADWDTEDPDLTFGFAV